MKKLLIVALTVVFTLSIASMAFAANTITTTDATATTNYDQYPTGYGAGAGGLSTGITAITSDSQNDNGYNNANNTGAGVGGQGDIGKAAVKNVTGQRTHGEYANNTNSCASCHQVHTAAASNLLFKDGVYQTCTACHDGTLGVLNVFAGSTAGTFGGTSDGHASMHLADGVMQTKAAPGGNHNGQTDAKGNDVSVGGAWAGEFNCASCHSPHGSYSDRLLNYNPNDIGDTDMYFRANGSFTDKDGNVLADQTKPVKSGGLKVVGAQVLPALPPADADSPDFVVYQTKSDSADLIDSFTGKTAVDNKVKQEPAGTDVIVLMKKVSKASPSDSTVTLYAYVRDVNPWMGNVYNYRSGKPLTEATNFFKTYSWTTNNADPTGTNPVEFKADGSGAIVVKFAQAYVKGTSLSLVKYADIARATVVRFDFLASDKASFNGLPVKEVDIKSYANSGYGVQISGFCASCHTDYFVSAGTDASGKGKGVWSKAFRHNTTSDNYTCLKCHFAHGTDVDVMLDAKDQSVKTLTAAGGKFEGDAVAAKAYMLDNNASSALKRYTNMSVCWKCHTSSHSEDLTQNVSYQGSLNSAAKGSTEFTATNDTTRPAGWVDATQSTLPYYGNQTTATYNK